jgi:hypothetical protein
MSVSIEQSIQAYSVVCRPGTLTVNVKVTNHGNMPIIGAAAGLGFWLQDQSGCFVPGFTRLDPPITDATGQLGNGQGFEREIHFTTGSPVDQAQQFTLTCVFSQTGDRETSTFNFMPVYLGTTGAPPFNT